MRVAAAALASVAMGMLAGSALAQTPTVPGVTVPAPPPVPAVTVPLPTVPKLPALDPAPAPAGPAATVPTAATSTAATATSSVSGATTATTSATAAGGSSASPSSPGYSSSAGAGRSYDRPQVKHLHSSRTWIGTTGKRSRRATTLTFVLPRADRVFFTVTKISPECALVGRFSVHGKAGLNRIRFAGRVGKRTLDAGTYRISARTGAGRVVQRVLLVVVDGSAPTSGELAAARASNECLSTARTTSSTAGGASSNTSGASFATPKGLRGAFSPGGDSAGSPAAPGSEFPTGGVLASAVEETARALQPALIVLLAAAIVLLAVASLPRVAVAGDRVNDTLARHRLEIAAVGAAALVAFAITLFLT